MLILSAIDMLFVSWLVSGYTTKQIYASYPNLILRLILCPGIGVMLVHCEQQGTRVMGQGGVYYLNDDVVEGVNPLADPQN